MPEAASTEIPRKQGVFACLGSRLPHPRRLHSKAICASSQVAFLLALITKRRATKQPRTSVSGLFSVTLTPVSVDFQAELSTSEASPRPVQKAKRLHPWIEDRTNITDSALSFRLVAQGERRHVCGGRHEPGAQAMGPQHPMRNEKILRSQTRAQARPFSSRVRSRDPVACALRVRNGRISGR